MRIASYHVLVAVDGGRDLCVLGRILIADLFNARTIAIDDFGIVEFMTSEGDVAIGCGDGHLAITEVEVCILHCCLEWKDVAHGSAVYVVAEKHEAAALGKYSASLLGIVLDSLEHGCVGCYLRKEQLWIATREIEEVAVDGDVVVQRREESDFAKLCQGIYVRLVGEVECFVFCY